MSRVIAPSIRLSVDESRSVSSHALADVFGTTHVELVNGWFYLPTAKGRHKVAVIKCPAALHVVGDEKTPSLRLIATLAIARNPVNTPNLGN